MAARLQKEPALAPLAAQFVLLKLETGPNPHWAAWSKAFPTTGSGIPKVYVVRADGEMLYGKSGAPADLAGFLKRQLAGTGRVLSVKELQELARAVKLVQRAVKRGEPAEAIELLGRHDVSDCYAAPAMALQQINRQLTEKATAQLKQAREDLQSEKNAFDAALSLVELERDYGGLAGFNDELEDALAEFRANEKTQPLLEQAGQFESARRLEADRRWKEALDAYRRIASKFSESEAAVRARRSIPALEKRLSGGGSNSGKKTARTEPSSDEKRAASQLRLGKLLLKRNKSAAKEYFERAIKLAPDSKVAAEARELLKEL